MSVLVLLAVWAHAHASVCDDSWKNFTHFPDEGGLGSCSRALWMMGDVSFCLIFEAFFALRPAGRECRVAGRRESSLPCVLPPESGATVMAYGLTFVINSPSAPQPPEPPPPPHRLNMPVHGEHAGAARVRRERRVRSFWRHEQMAIQMVLAAVQHHSHGVLRNQRTATRTGGEAREVLHGHVPEAPLPQGGQHLCLRLLAGRSEASTAALRGARRRLAVRADSRCSRAASVGQCDQFLPSLGPAGCRAGYRCAHDLLVFIPSEFQRILGLVCSYD